MSAPSEFAETSEVLCNGKCMNGYDQGMSHSGIVWADPECPMHGTRSEFDGDR